MLPPSPIEENNSRTAGGGIGFGWRGVDAGYVLFTEQDGETIHNAFWDRNFRP